MHFQYTSLLMWLAIDFSYQPSEYFTTASTDFWGFRYLLKLSCRQSLVLSWWAPAQLLWCKLPSTVSLLWQATDPRFALFCSYAWCSLCVNISFSVWKRDAKHSRFEHFARRSRRQAQLFQRILSARPFQPQSDSWRFAFFAFATWFRHWQFDFF